MYVCVCAFVQLHEHRPVCAYASICTSMHEYVHMCARALAQVFAWSLLQKSEMGVQTWLLLAHLCAHLAVGMEITAGCWTDLKLGEAGRGTLCLLNRDSS